MKNRLLLEPHTKLYNPLASRVSIGFYIVEEREIMLYEGTLCVSTTLQRHKVCERSNGTIQDEADKFFDSIMKAKRLANRLAAQNNGYITTASSLTPIYWLVQEGLIFKRVAENAWTFLEAADE